MINESFKITNFYVYTFIYLFKYIPISQPVISGTFIHNSIKKLFSI